ncbi:exo-alpha-sialidase [Methylococcaceae bacterium WWC4]|nr:exo-alpha-sialidase [Methylococcaceae bacterium WWC4]
MTGGRLDPITAACLLLLGAQAPLANANAVTYQQFVSVQMNVDAGGHNVTGDAAHEPTIAQDPNNPKRLVAGWKQFTTVASGNRQGGWAYSDDGGLSWHFPGVVTPGEQRTNIMVDVDSAGDFYYQNLHYDATGSYAQDVQVLKSTDGGISWGVPIHAYGEGADKGRIGIDRSGTSSDGHVYLVWREGLDDRRFTRSSNGGISFEAPVAIPESPAFGTIAVGPAGQTYVSGRSEDGELVGAKLVFGKYLLATSLNARDPGALPSFTTQTVDMGGSPVMFQFQNNPNQYGPPGDLQVNVDQSDGPLRGNIYLMSSVDPAGADNQDVKFIRSSDGGLTWSAPVKINDDTPHKDAYQWFAMQGVAPNGRIDAVWYDTRDNLRPALSRLYYSYSWDGGLTWSKNRPVTPVFNTHIAYPLGAQKLGDYTHLVSDALGAHVAYSATYNGEQDVYYLNVYPDCNDNGVSDVSDIELRRTGDTNANHLPDSCENMVVPGDLDADKDVDKQDLNALLALRNRPARGSEDPADLDRNGVINLLDARRQALLCTRAQCAIQ